MEQLELPMWAQDKQAPLVERSKLPGPWEVQQVPFCATAELDDIFAPKNKIAPCYLDEIYNQETDPTGRDAHAPGAKLDAGKNRLGLVLMDFAEALVEVGKVGTFGANKYTPHGWVSVPDAEQRYTDAMFRHIMAEGRGEETDTDSGLLHAAQTAWNALARLTFILKRTQNEVALNTEESCPKN